MARQCLRCWLSRASGNRLARASMCQRVLADRTGVHPHGVRQPNTTAPHFVQRKLVVPYTNGLDPFELVGMFQ